MNTYYENDFKYDLNALTIKRIKIISSAVISKLISLNPDGKSLLDIGSGHGYILESGNNSGIKTLGIEPSIYLYKETKQNLNVINSDLENFIKNTKKKFDFITLVHVIEHIPNPQILQKQLSRLLNKQGVIYIETPNFDSWLRYFERCEYTFLTPPDHIFIFSIKTIQNVFKNWQIVHKCTYSYPEHFIGILRVLKKRLMKKQEGKSNNKGNTTQIITPLKKKNSLVELLSPLGAKIFNINNHGSIIKIFLKKDLDN